MCIECSEIVKVNKLFIVLNEKFDVFNVNFEVEVERRMVDLYWLFNRDLLINLFNCNGFFKYFNNLIDIICVFDNLFVFLFIDLDGFK